MPDKQPLDLSKSLRLPRCLQAQLSCMAAGRPKEAASVSIQGICSYPACRIVGMQPLLKAPSQVD